MKNFLTCLAAITLIGLMGCQQKSSAEKAGERIDEIIDNVEEGSAPLKEMGRFQKMGESIDDSIKENSN